MDQRGRKSSAAVAVIRTDPERTRLAAPGHLSAAARRVWDEVVGSRPAEFFTRGEVPLLETYCTASAEHRRLAAIVCGLDPVGDLDTLAKLTRLMDAHALRIGAAATKLRLSTQARYDAKAAASATKRGGTWADRVRAGYEG